MRKKDRSQKFVHSFSCPELGEIGPTMHNQGFRQKNRASES